MRRLPQSLLVLLGCFAMAAYFGHHTISGKYGLKAQAELLDRKAVVEQQIAGLGAAQARLKRDIGLLNQSPPDPDLVEEMARSTLGFARAEDRIFVSR
ncbi:MAG: septum formation initiator family protein [Pseudomonadota bacterium]